MVGNNIEIDIFSNNIEVLAAVWINIEIYINYPFSIIFVNKVNCSDLFKYQNANFNFITNECV